MMSFFLSTIIFLVEIVRTAELSVNPPEYSLKDNPIERDSVESPDQLGGESNKSGRDTPCPFKEPYLPSCQSKSGDIVSTNTEQDENVEKTAKMMRCETHGRPLQGDLDIHVKFRWFYQPSCSKPGDSNQIMNFEEERIRHIIEKIQSFLGASGDISVNINSDSETIKKDDKAKDDVVSGKDKLELDDAIPAKSDNSVTKKDEKMNTCDDEGIADDK